MTDHLPPRHDRRDSDEPSPFESSPRGSLHSVSRTALLTILVGGAAFAAWWFTRAGTVAEAAPSAASGVDSNGGPVMLTPESARRIGVTYAVV
jgi:hypothetical protein